jgi:hypothetical protein
MALSGATNGLVTTYSAHTYLCLDGGSDHGVREMHHPHVMSSAVYASLPAYGGHIVSGRRMADHVQRRNGDGPLCEQYAVQYFHPNISQPRKVHSSKHLRLTTRDAVCSQPLCLRSGNARPTGQRRSLRSPDPFLPLEYSTFSPLSKSQRAACSFGSSYALESPWDEAGALGGVSFGNGARQGVNGSVANVTARSFACSTTKYQTRAISLSGLHDVLPTYHAWPIYHCPTMVFETLRDFPRRNRAGRWETA